MNMSGESNALPQLTAELRIKMAIGAQFVELQVLQDQLAAAQREVAKLGAELAKRNAEYEAQVVEVTTRLEHRDARIAELERQIGIPIERAAE